MRLTEGRLGALSERPFRLLWLGQTASFVGDSLIPVATVFAVLEIGAGAPGIGLVLGTLTAFRVAFILVGGVWADRLPRRAVMVACDAVRAVGAALVAAAVLTGAMELWMFVGWAALFGTAMAFFQPASTGIIPQLVPAERLQQANALLTISRTSTSVFGPAAAGVLVALASPGLAFAVDAASYLISAGFLLAMPVRRLAPAARRRFLSEVAEGWREAWSRGWLRVGFLAAAAANVGIAFFTVLGPVIAEDELGGAAGWGAIVTGGAIGGVIGGMLALRLRPARPLVWCFAAWSLGVLPPLALVPPLPVAAVAVAFGAFLFGIYYGNAVWEAVLQREVAPERLSRVGAIDWMVALVFMPVGQVAAGPLSEAIGLEATLVGAALLVAVSCAIGLMSPSVIAMRSSAEVAVGDAVTRRTAA